MFGNPQKGVVEAILHKFRMLKVTFDEFIVKRPSLRANCIIFLTVFYLLKPRRDKSKYCNRAICIRRLSWQGRQPLLGSKTLGMPGV